MASERSPTEVTLSVWRALFLREAVSRMSRQRAAWLWVLAEPIVHIAFIMFLFATVRVRVIGGIETPVWIMVGLLAFFMFRRTAQQGLTAVSGNQALFTYRQVKPVDTVLVRAVLEGFLMLITVIVVMAGAALFGVDVRPADPLAVLAVLGGMWLIGLGFGLMGSVASELVSELGRFIAMVLQPLYFFSGVIFPIAKVPPPYRDWLMVNPLAHGLEAARLGFAPHYQAVPGTSIPYIYACAVGLVFLGLALHFRFSTQLATR